VSPLLTLLSSILLVAAPGRARADQSASPEESYRAALREAFLHAAPPPSPPSKADLGDPNDPKSTAGLARTIVALEAGTAADPLASIRAEAAAFSAASPAMPPEDVVADYLRRRKAAGGASVKGPTGTPPPDRGTPDSARGAQLHALELANALGSTAGPGGAPTPAVATVPSAVPATNALPRAPTAVSDLRASAPPSPSVGAPAAAPGLLAGFGTWSLETGRGYATGAANLVLDAANLSNRGANALLSLTPIQYRFQQDMHIAPASATERYAQNAVQAASLLSGVYGVARSAPEIAAVSDSLAARAGEIGDRLLRRGEKKKYYDPPPPPRDPLPPETPSPGPRTPTGSAPIRGAHLDRGQFTDVFMCESGDCVMKFVHEDIGAGRPLTLQERSAIAARTVEQHAALRARGFPVPESWVSPDDPTVIVQRFSGGPESVPLDALPEPLRTPAARAAIDMRQLAKTDRRVSIDDGGLGSNFRFDPATGAVRAWIDPSIPLDTQELQPLQNAIWLQRGGR
jgi:hypothetical protein